MKSSLAVLCIVIAAGLALAVQSEVMSVQPLTCPIQMNPEALLGPNEMTLAPNGEPAWVPGPEETLYWDGGVTKQIGPNAGGTWRAAARFTPTFACTLKAIYFAQAHASENEYAFVFGENYDSFPGPILDSMAYPGSPPMNWKRINLNTPIPFQAGTDFWTCVRFTNPAGTQPCGSDDGPMVNYRGGFVSLGTAWNQVPFLGVSANFCIRAIVTRGTMLAHDVGATRIRTPVENINPGTYQPRVKIANFGLNAESDIPVTLRIDSAGVELYSHEELFYGPLQPGSNTVVTIPYEWTSGPRGASYNVTAYTALDSDMDRSDDTVKQVTNLLTRQVLMTHDTGYCALTVTSFGAIGYENTPVDAGEGFRYPKQAQTSLYYSGFAVGNSPDYVADRYYGYPPGSQPNPDLVTAESLIPIQPSTGDEQFRGAYTDSGHAAPKGLLVVQNTHQSAEPGYDDFVVMAFDIYNRGAEAVNGLYAGVFADFDVGSAPTSNTAASDEGRRIVYMKPGAVSDNPSVGLQILAPGSFANLSAIDHGKYVYPDSAMTDGMKYRFLDGTVAERTSNRPYDWSIMASAGPFDLEPDSVYRFALAFVGGSSAANILANADSAQSWYNNNTGIVHSPVRPDIARMFNVTPNPCRDRALVNYHAARDGRLLLSVYDAGGRLVDEMAVDVKAGAGSYLWQPRNLARGVYFLDIEVPENRSRVKTLLLD